MKRDPISPEYLAAMNEMAGIIDHGFNGSGKKKVGFALLTYNFAENIKGTGRVNYIGNGKREDVLVALKELVARWEGRYDEPETEQGMN